MASFRVLNLRATLCLTFFACFLLVCSANAYNPNGTPRNVGGASGSKVLHRSPRFILLSKLRWLFTKPTTTTHAPPPHQHGPNEAHNPNEALRPIQGPAPGPAPPPPQPTQILGPVTERPAEKRLHSAREVNN